MSKSTTIPHFVLSRAWRDHPSEFRYSVVTQADELYFIDGSVAIRSDDDVWTAVVFAQLANGSEADLFVASTRGENI